jgi:hypothetical protein
MICTRTKGRKCTNLLIFAVLLLLLILLLLLLLLLLRLLLLLLYGPSAYGPDAPHP